ncbi:Dolichyl-phosphate-mannose-protein mannosyltransferase [Maioricimonas rarisocia]|uniref:Dolichyl-phosphate-mannose-protein mannosyltransferase n=1 Tax=Maioricimonas rarisocia TaxID=2528026 RepID=A0A517Z740_9PLAN|nr:glycosyltransferase family 39 protein [Maioricimonas rarisocia]QDU38264.1 Dolichyl-phosphate-mannose-protein mannosyltransferase [Maioricimonas rarisocia]
MSNQTAQAEELADPPGASCCWWIGPAFFALSLTALLVHFATKYGLDVPPSATGDEPSYDSIGWELSQGRGYRIDYSNEQFLEPYLEASRSADPPLPIPEGRDGPTALRPPLFPLVIAGTDLLFGRQFWVIRVVNCLAMAATCGLIAHFACRLTGAIPAVVMAFGFLILDVRTRLYARAILTEALACLLVAGMTAALLRYRGTGGWKNVVVAGLCLGVAVLDRPMLVVWLPVVALLVVLCKPSRPAGGVPPLFRWVPRLSEWVPRLCEPCSRVSLFLIAASIVVVPWMAWNCVRLDAFKPLGTQGMIELPAGFSDAAWENRGIWRLQPEDECLADVESRGLSGLQWEVALADCRREKAVEWIRTNPGRSILLGVMKIGQELRPRTVWQGVLLVLAVVGAFAMTDRRGALLLVGIVAAQLLAIAMTWSVEGRFMVPLQFPVYILASCGLGRLLLSFGLAKRRGLSAVEAERELK